MKVTTNQDIAKVYGSELNALLFIEILSKRATLTGDTRSLRAACDAYALVFRDKKRDG